MNILYLNITARQVIKQLWFASQNQFNHTLYNDPCNYLATKLQVSKRTIERIIATLIANNLVQVAKKDGRIRRFSITDFGRETKPKWDIGKDNKIYRKCYLTVYQEAELQGFSVAENVAEVVAENVVNPSKPIYIYTPKYVKSSSISPSKKKKEKKERKEEDFLAEHERLKQKYGDQAYEKAMNYIASGKQIYNLELFLKVTKQNLDIVHASPVKMKPQTTTPQATITKGQERNIKANLEAFTSFANGHTGLPVKVLYDDLKVEIGNDTLYMYDEPKYIIQTLEGLKTDKRIKQQKSSTYYSAETLMKQLTAKVRVV